MTGAQLKTMVDTILDDSIDDIFFYQLLNIAKNTLEDERTWQFLRKLDSSKTATGGDNSEVAIALPTDWRSTYKLMVGKDFKYIQVPFDEQHIWRYTSSRFCIDVANSVFYLLGTIGASDTIYHYYIKTTNDIESGTEWVAPSRFHPILAFMVAGYYMNGVDADDIFARMSPENKIMAQTLKASMIAWDMKLQLEAQNDQIQIADAEVGIDLGMM